MRSTDPTAGAASYTVSATLDPAGFGVFAGTHKACPIEQIQPYHGASSGLWLLHKLSAAFRHNVIHVATIYLLESVYHLQIDGEPRFPNVLEIIPHEQVEDGDLLMRFKLETQGKDVKPAVPIHIGIDHPLCEDRDGLGVLNEIARDVQIAMDTVDRLIHT